MKYLIAWERREDRPFRDAGEFDARGFRCACLYPDKDVAAGVAAKLSEMSESYRYQEVLALGRNPPAGEDPHDMQTGPPPATA